jgi:hypothetical protein
MYILTQEDGHRPVIVDDKNDYCLAGIDRKWINNNYLNGELRLPLSLLGTFRAHIESSLLMQNLMLTLQAMGLGGWIHASYEGPFLLDHPAFVEPDEGILAGLTEPPKLELKTPQQGLGFRYEIPGERAQGYTFKEFLQEKIAPNLQRNQPGTFEANYKKAIQKYQKQFQNAQPVGLDNYIETMTVPYHKSMDAAVDSLLAIKYAKGTGTYSNKAQMEKIFKTSRQADYFISNVPHYDPRTIEIVKSICNYIYDTHKRFPAHTDAIHVPGIWLQAHKLDLKYYDTFFKDGYTSTQQKNEQLWGAYGMKRQLGGRRRGSGQ